MTQDPRASDVIDDRYELLEVVGAGGMGKVFRARDRVLDRIVAVKVIREDIVDDDFLRRFEREAAILARVRSPHIVVVFDYGSSEGRFYLVTDFLADGDLAQLVSRRGPLPPAEAATILAGLADGLADAHAHGVIHRDIKPGNVLLWRRAGELRPVLADFGIAVTADLGLTATGGVIGSPPYMAPERHLGRPATEATDLYAMGCLAYNLLTGAPPFRGTGFQVANAHINDPVPALPPTLDRAPEWDALVARCMAKDPAERIGSAAELATAFRHLAAPPPPPPPSPSTAPVRRGAGRLVAVLAALALVVAGAGGAWWLLRDDGGPAGPAAEDPVTSGSVAPVAPGKVSARAVPAALAVAVAVTLPAAEDGSRIVLERRDDAGAWQESAPELEIATPRGGVRACTTLRLVAVAGEQRAEGPEAEVCGKSAPARVVLARSLAASCAYPLDAPAPDGARSTPCTWFDAQLTGFPPEEFVSVRLLWVVDGKPRTEDVADVRVSIGKDGAGAAGEHEAASVNGGLCPKRRCDGGFAVPDLIGTVEVQALDGARKVLARLRVDTADVT